MKLYFERREAENEPQTPHNSHDTQQNNHQILSQRHSIAVLYMLHSRRPIPAQPTAPHAPSPFADDPRRCGCGVSLDELVARMLLEQCRHRLGQQRLGGEVVEPDLLAPRARLLAVHGTRVRVGAGGWG